MRKWIALAAVVGAFVGGMAWGQDDGGDPEPDLLDMETRLAQVKREVKIISFETAMAKVPALIERERGYEQVLSRIADSIKRGEGDLNALLEKGRRIKLDALKDLNRILKLHKGKHAGLSETEVWARLTNARFEEVEFDDEWLVNILDWVEDHAEINIEVDARVYKFDTVTFDFEKTSARAMLQMMGDALSFTWLVRGDTLYVFRERHEILFGGEWIRSRKSAWRARRKALEAAAKEAERRALAGEGGATGEGGR